MFDAGKFTNIVRDQRANGGERVSGNLVSLRPMGVPFADRSNRVSRVT
jgi:hypothetical protein